MTEDRAKDYIYTGTLDAPQSPFCATCGRCCEQHPGQTIPSDLGEDWEAEARRRLESGRWAIDWWEGDLGDYDELEQVYHLRPAIVGHEGQVFHAAWGGACTFLTATGCGLTREERPTVCKALIPKRPGGKCNEGMTKGNASYYWRPYSERLAEIGCEVEEMKNG